ncbi:MAG: DUF5689 domain-containing protein [Bernardetiaceae bacterium]
MQQFLQKDWLRRLILLGLSLFAFHLAQAQTTVVAYLPNTAAADPAAVTATGVTGLNLSRGAGLTENAGAGFNSRGWTQTGGLAQAKADNSYLEWGFTATTAYNLSTMSIRFYRSSTGPSDVVIEVSINGGAYQSVYTNNAVTTSTGGASNISGIDLSAFTNVTSATFRMYGFGASSGTGTMRIRDTNAFDGTNGLIVYGTAGGPAGPTISISETLTTFISGGVGSPSSEQSYTVSGSDLTGDVSITAPSNFEVSLTSGSGFGSSVVIPVATANSNTTNVFVRYNPTSAPLGHTGNIVHTSAGAATRTVSVTGQGVSTIAAARALPQGSIVSITGTFTVSSQFNGPAYIQDATGGIAIFDNQVHGVGNFNIGDSVTVTGTRSAFNNEQQLINLTQVTPHGTANRPVVPQVITLSQLNDPNLTGKLVHIQNANFPGPGDLLFGNSNFILNDASGNGEMRIDGATNLVGRVQPSSCSVVGVIGQFNALFQLKPRFTADIPCAQPYTPPTPATACIPQAASLDVVSWNIEWFGHPANSPAGNNPNATQIQTDSVRKVLLALNADVYAFQEITDTTAMRNLINSLPGYNFVVSDAVSYPPAQQQNSQQLIIAYRTSVVKPLETKALLRTMHPYYNGNVTPTELNAFPDADKTRFWASGRLPFMMKAEVTINNVKDTISFVNIHARANGSTNAQGRYDMRKFDIDALEDSLRNQYTNDKIVLLGDYNDDVDVTVADVSTTTTTYISITSRPSNYRTLTRPLSDAGFRSFVSRENMIDHISVNNRLFNASIANSERVHYEFYNINYDKTTSDHFPISARLEVQAVPACNFSATGTSQTSVNLAWTDVSGIETDYLLEVSTDQNNWAAVATLPANSSSYTHTGLTAGTTYYYRLFTRAGATNVSTAVTATAQTQAAAQPAITVTATPATINGQNAESIEFTFTSSVPVSGDLTVNFAVGGTAVFNQDYYVLRGAETFTTTAGTVIIPNGQTTRTITIQAQANRFGGNKTVILTVQAP